MTQEERSLIGARVRDIRLQRRLTQEELAQIAGLSACVVSSVEHGRSITLDSIVALTCALGASLDYVVRGLRPQMGAWGLMFRADEDAEEPGTPAEQPENA